MAAASPCLARPVPTGADGVATKCAAPRGSARTRRSQGPARASQQASALAPALRGQRAPYGGGGAGRPGRGTEPTRPNGTRGDGVAAGPARATRGSLSGDAGAAGRRWGRLSPPGRARGVFGGHPGHLVGQPGDRGPCRSLTPRTRLRVDWVRGRRPRGRESQAGRAATCPGDSGGPGAALPLPAPRLVPLSVRLNKESACPTRTFHRKNAPRP